MAIPEDHPDLWQSFGSRPNRIMMDGKIIGGEIQLIFMDAGVSSNTDVAIVNVVMAATGHGLGQMESQVKNVLFWNVELSGQRLVITDVGTPGISPTFGMFGSIISYVASSSNDRSDIYQWDYNQFGFEKAVGTNAVLLDPEFDSNFFVHKAVVIPKRTVRWDRDQKPRNTPYYTGAYASPGIH